MGVLQEERKRLLQEIEEENLALAVALYIDMLQKPTSTPYQGPLRNGCAAPLPTSKTGQRISLGLGGLPLPQPKQEENDAMRYQRFYGDTGCGPYGENPIKTVATYTVVETTHTRDAMTGNIRCKAFLVGEGSSFPREITLQDCDLKAGECFDLIPRPTT
jgi:hypothetical protein